jgi:hypothetical protein
MRLLTLLAMVMLLGALAQAGPLLVGGRDDATASGVATAPASGEVSVYRLIQVNYLDLGRLTEALGGYTLNLYGGGGQQLGVVPDAAQGIRNFFNGGRATGGNFTSPAAGPPSLTVPR